MSSVFTRIINGDLPGHFVWKDDRCVAFLSINPLAVGHTLVVPRDEVDHWLDLGVDANQHMLEVGHAIGTAQMAVFSPVRIGLIVAGFEVPHMHLHVIPANGMGAFDFARAATDVDHHELARQAAALREHLVAAGHASAETGP